MSGLSSQKLDDKWRWNVPVDLRDALGIRFWLTINADNNIVAIPGEQWELLKAKWQQQLSAQPENERLYDAIDRTLTYASAVDTTVTNGWRIPIPELLRKKAGLKKEIVTVGTLDHVVLWDKDRFDKAEGERYEHPDTLKIQRLILRGVPLQAAMPETASAENDNGDSRTETACPGDGQ